MTSAMGDNHLPESLSGHCGCFRYHELNTHKVTKDQIPYQPGGWVLHQPPWSLGSIPKREEPGKTGEPCVKVPGSSRVPVPPWVGSRSPYGWDQIPYRPGGWVLHQSPWSFGFDSQTRGTRENRRTLC